MLFVILHAKNSNKIDSYASTRVLRTDRRVSYS